MAKGSLKSRIEHCLREFPETRNDDIDLMLKVWEVFYPSRIRVGASGKKGVWFEDFHDLPREDHVKRIRAHYQNDLGKYLPTKLDVALKRKLNEDVWREAMGYPPKSV